MSRSGEGMVAAAGGTDGSPRRVLYVQHAGCLGGSATSLRLLTQGMQAAGIDCTIALARPSSDLVDYYTAAGVPAVPAPGICCWDHSTVARRSLTNPRHVLDLAMVARGWRRSRDATLRLVDRLRPDLVHLNSMPLSSSAAALTDSGFPFVWHVREPPPDQGIRTRMISRIMRSAPQCVFITEYDRRQWIGDAPAEVVYNCVPDDWFVDRAVGRQGGGVPVRFAYLGGYSAPKGVGVLVDALRRLRSSPVRWECVMPACLPDGRTYGRRRPLKRLARWLGYRNLGERLLPELRLLQPQVRLEPFVLDVRSLLEGVDFVVFPATQPHFPRPVIEAAALGKPAVGTAVGGVDECIIPGETGLSCPPGDAAALARSLEAMISDGVFRSAAGVRARERALRRHSLSAQIEAVARVYRRVLAGRRESLTETEPCREAT